MTAVLLGAVLGAAFIALLVLARRIGTRPTPAGYAAFRQLPEGARWLPCHTTACAHLTTIHTPQPGGYTCANCAHTPQEPTDGR